MNIYELLDLGTFATLKVKETLRGSLMPKKSEWIERFRQTYTPEWQALLKELFPVAIPSECVWSTVEDIIAVLNKISSKENLNHMFLPSGGGNDLSGAEESTESGTIALVYGCVGADIVKPISLAFNSFDTEYLWAYFRLETGGLQPTGVCKRYDSNDKFEELTELEPGKYADRSAWDNKYYSSEEEGTERPIPKTSRPVVRYFRGSFVIFAKGSFYNYMPETYEAPHENMTPEEFRNHIAGIVQMQREIEVSGDT